jgi:threonine dehydrogenase-like Zn-dependent dehydrogenase
LRATDHEVLVWSREPGTSANAELARSVGASYASAEEVTVEEIGRGGDPIDLVYEATGSAEVAFALIEAIGPNATIVWTGLPGRSAKADVDGARMMRELVLGNHVVLGTVSAGRGAYERAVRDLVEFESRWPGVTRGLITSRHGLEAASKRICAREEGIKSVVDLHPVGA